MATRYPDLAFRGAAGSGKTTAARILEIGFDYRQRAFADALKIRVHDGIWTYAQHLPESYKIATVDDHKPKLRRLLQEYGEAVREIFDEDYWVHECARWFENQEQETRQPRVISDLRFQREQEVLKDQGFVIVEVVPDPINLVLSGPAADHRSEHALDGIPADYVLVNPINEGLGALTGNLENLLKKIQEAS